MKQQDAILTAYHSQEAQREAAEKALAIHSQCLLHFLNKLPYSHAKKRYLWYSSMIKEIKRYEAEGIVF